MKHTALTARIALAALVALAPACKRTVRERHYVSVIDGSGTILVGGMFGMLGPAGAMFTPRGSVAGLRPGRCVRLDPRAANVPSPEALRNPRPNPAGRLRNAGPLVVEDGEGNELSVLRPMFMGMYSGVVPRGAARAVRVSVGGGDGVAPHTFPAIPLNPEGNPLRITSPGRPWTGRRGAPLRITWTGAGYHDAYLSVALATAEGRALALTCLVDVGRGSITLAGNDMDLPGASGPVLANVSLHTQTGSEDGAWVISAVSMAAPVSGMLR